MRRSSHLCYYSTITIICCLILITCSVSYAAVDAASPGAEGVMPDPDAVIRKILGVDEMAKNVCLIDSHQMVNAADLPGRLSTEREVGWIDVPEQVSPKPEGNTQNGTTDIIIEQPKDNGSSGITTVMPK